MLKQWEWMRSHRESVARTVGGRLSLGGHWSLRTERRESRLQERGGIVNVRNRKSGNVPEVKGSKCQGRRDKLTRKSCWTERRKATIGIHSLHWATGKSYVVFRERSSRRNQSAGFQEVKRSWRGERERRQLCREEKLDRDAFLFWQWDWNHFLTKGRYQRTGSIEKN